MNLMAIGRVGRAHGLKGEFRLTVFGEDPGRYAELGQVFAVLGPERTRFAVQGVKFLSRGVPVLKLEGVDDRDGAEALKGRILEVDADSELTLEQGEYFVHDIVGLEVRDLEDRVLGRVVRVENAPAYDYYVVDRGGSELMIPAVDEFVKRIDIESGLILVHVEGLE